MILSDLQYTIYRMDDEILDKNYAKINVPL